MSAMHDSGGVGALPGSDGLRGDMTSVVVPSEQLEYEADALLDAWEPLMAQVRCSALQDARAAAVRIPCRLPPGWELLSTSSDRPRLAAGHLMSSHLSGV